MTAPTRRACLAAAAAAAWPVAARADDNIVEVGGSRIELIFDGDFAAEPRAAIQLWATRAASTLVAFLGHFPVPRLELYARAAEGRGARRGTTFAEPEPFVSVQVGRQSRAENLAEDWILVHEFVHLAVPQVPRPQRWLHEGIATYVEGVARARSGWTDAPQFWAEMVRGLPQGLPAAGDRGLDHTPTWGRTYWGGALFCLLADVDARRRGRTSLGLREGLRRLHSIGASYAVAWPATRILQEIDTALAHPSFSEFYAAMKDKPVSTDLPALWRELGVNVEMAGSAPARLDDRAPLAAVRRTIVG